MSIISDTTSTYSRTYTNTVEEQYARSARQSQQTAAPGEAASESKGDSVSISSEAQEKLQSEAAFSPIWSHTTDDGVQIQLDAARDAESGEYGTVKITFTDPR